MKNSQSGLSTRAIHFGYQPNDFLGAVNPPVFLNATYSFENSVDYEDSMSRGTLYGRQYNPTNAILEKKLANLDGGEAALTAASGMGAIGTMMMGLLSQGDEIIHHRTVYVCTGRLLGELPRFGIKTVPVDLTDPANLAAAITPNTKMIYFELPVNPLLEVIDIAAVAEYALKANVMVVVDATFSSPAICRPLEHGANVVVHSLTKYINGHGNLLSGAVIAKADVIKRLRVGSFDHITGATLHPLAAATIMQGLKTLTIRMERHASSALVVAEMLERHSAISWVKYPFLKSHPQYSIAKRQMASGSGMVSFGVRSGYAGARRVMDRLQLIARAVSLGDASSLIVHQASLRPKNKAIMPAGENQIGVGDEMLRLSVGLEDPEDIISDLEQALSAE